MTRTTLSLFVALTAFGARGADLVLPPGTSTYLKAGETTQVRCEQAGSSLPVCTIDVVEHAGATRYAVKVGAKQVERYPDSGTAAGMVRQLRGDGVCQ